MIQLVVPGDPPGMGLPSISPDREYWAYAESAYSGDPGLWFGEFARAVVQIFPESCWDVTWTPGGEGFFFFSEAGLYFAPAPSFMPVLIGEGISVIHVDPTTWVYP